MDDFFDIVIFFYFIIGKPTILASHPEFSIFHKHRSFRQTRIVEPLFNRARIALNIVKMRFYVRFTKHKAKITYLFFVCVGKILFPIERDIAAFDNEILLIFDSRFDHLLHDAPQIRR